MHTNNRTLDYLTEEAVTSLPGSIFSTTHSCTTTLIVMLAHMWEQHFLQIH